MKENIKKLEKQIDLLIEQYKRCKTVNRGRIILSSIDGLLELYQVVTNEQYKKINEIDSLNPYYYQKYVEYNNQKRNLFIRNFLEYKDFHYSFICNIINEFNFFTYDYDILYPPTHNQKELDQLLKDYCLNTNSDTYLIYNKLKSDNCFFNISKKSDYCGSIHSDYYNKVDFIVFRNQKQSLETLATLIHEIGHVEDFKNMSSSKLVDYIYRSPFSEVHSLKEEKQFYDYLLKNKIYDDEIKNEVLFECDNIIEHLVSLLIYSKMPSSYLEHFDTSFIKNIWILEAIQETDLNPLFVLNNFEMIDFFDSYIYSYGELLSTYFLEHPDKYEAFRSRRYDFFHPSLFQKLDITSSDIVKSLYKRYEKYK